MSLKDLILADLNTVIMNTDECAETAVYHPINGAPVTLTVVPIDQGTQNMVDGQGITTEDEMLCVMIRRADIASPQLGDEIEYDGRRWKIDDQSYGMDRQIITNQVSHTITFMASEYRGVRSNNV